jgi:O-acetyl-ADP-ribose deacetylase (regulator of RNase III)
MHIEFCVPHRAVYLAVQPIFDGIENVTVSHESIISGEHEAIVAVGNPFAEVHWTIRSLFGDDIENRVRTTAKERFGGEMTVGQAVVVPVDHPMHKWLIYAPIVHQNMYEYDISNTNRNAYTAFRGVLAAMREAGITAASTPLFSKKTGLTPVVYAARQMRAALESTA